MDAAGVIREARRRAGLTQRELADRAGIPQPSVARLESGRVSPRVETLERLLRVTGEELRVGPRRGVGVDRSLIGSFLRLSPRERLERLTQSAEALTRLREAALRQRRSP